MSHLRHDLRFAVRKLLKRPGVTLGSLLALAVAIGANTAIFSVVNALLLAPLPYPEADRIALLWVDNRNQQVREDLTSFPNFRDWQEQSESFAAMAVFTDWRPTLSVDGQPEYVQGATVSADFFEVFGVHPRLGRTFTRQEHTAGGGNLVVLGHDFWQRRFGADPGVLGRDFPFGGDEMKVVGVMPAGFDFPGDVDVWAPLVPSDFLRQARQAFIFKAVGRLEPAVTLERARREMEVIGRRLEAAYPEANAGLGVRVVPLRDQISGEVKPAILALMGAVVFVLLIACGNVVALLMARAATREREAVIRVALGARRRRLIREYLAESGLLAVLGGAGGLVLGKLAIDLFKALEPDFPRLSEISIDLRVLLFTLGASLAACLLFGLPPALQASRVDQTTSLKEGGRQVIGSRRKRRLFKALVVVECAMALVLVTGAGLLVNSFQRLVRLDPGFDPDRLLILKLRLPSSRYPNLSDIVAFHRQLGEKLRSLPGIESVGAASSVLEEGPANSVTITLEGRPPLSAAESELPFIGVTPGYFETMRTPILRGASLSGDGSGGEWTTLVNAAMAERYWPGEDPIGKRFKLGTADSAEPWMSIVGVVGDMRRFGLESAPRPEFYMPLSPALFRTMNVVVRTAQEPFALAPSVRAQVWQLDDQLPLIEVTSAETMLRESLAHRRLATTLLSVTAAVALLLSTLGVYGILSYLSAVSTAEIGLRMALGAGRRGIVLQSMKQALVLVGAGIVAGLLGALVLTRALSSLLYGIRPTDPLTFGIATTLLIAVSALASLLPARRAAQVDPAEVMRVE